MGKVFNIGLILLLCGLNSLFCTDISQKTITGIVQSASKAPLPYVNISTIGTNTGTTTDVNGRYNLEVNPGNEITILFHHIGYEPSTITLTDDELLNISKLNVTLDPKAISFSPIEVIGESALSKQQMIESSMMVIRQEDLQALPSITGSDVFRSLQALPGVLSTSELSNQLYIRGGTPDQNLVLLNGVPIYQPFHMFGLSSSLDPSSIDIIKYYSGGFSAEYGDRLSGVLDITTKSGTDSLSANMDLNLFNIGGAVSGSISKKWRWRVSGRQTYYDQIFDMLGEDFPYKYYDWEGKLSYMPRPNHLITCNIFYSADDYLLANKIKRYNPAYQQEPDITIAHADSNTYWEDNHSAIDWTNRVGSIQWMARLNNKLSFETTAYLSELEQGIDFLHAFVVHDSASLSTIAHVENENTNYMFDDEGVLADTRLSHYGITTKGQYVINPDYTVSLGADISKRNLKYGWNSLEFNMISRYLNVFMDYAPDSMNYDKQISSFSGFGELLVTKIERLPVRLGIRAVKHSLNSEAILEPRLNIGWIINTGSQVKLSLGRYSQLLSSSVEYGFYNIASLYFPNTVESIPTSDHAILSYSYTDIDKIKLVASLYSKSYSNLLYVDKNSTFNTTSGYSWGTELSMAYRWRRLFSQLAYTYSLTRKKEAGEYYYPNYDQRHKLTCGLSYPLKRGLSVSTSFSFNTGRPANLEESLYYTGFGVADTEWSATNPYPISIILEVPKNFLRYPCYHRLDIKINKYKKLKKGRLNYYLQLINIYDRQNVIYYEDVYEADVIILGRDPDTNIPLSRVVYKAKAFNGFPLFPLVGVSYEF